MANVLRIHFLVPDDAGPIRTEPAGAPMKVGRPGRHRVACDASIVMGDWDRGTNCPWAVMCNACKATEIFRQLDRPKPGRVEDVPDRAEEPAP